MEKLFILPAQLSASLVCRSTAFSTVFLTEMHFNTYNNSSLVWQ